MPDNIALMYEVVLFDKQTKKLSQALNIKEPCNHTEG